MKTEIDMFDAVRIVDAPVTAMRGYANKEGVCYGITTPSVTGVDVIGKSGDRALNVHFEGEKLADAWFAPELVEFVDHGPGTVITIGQKTLRRNADGSWIEQ